MSTATAVTASDFAARIRAYQQKRRLFAPERLLPYAGQWVAFSADGARIVAADAVLAELEAKLAAQGIDPQEVLFEQVDIESATGSVIGIEGDR